MSASLHEWLAAQAARLEASGLTRHLQPRSPRHGPDSQDPDSQDPDSQDHDLVDLAGNDYLGLSTHPRVIEGAVNAVRTWGAGSTGSRLVTGSTDLHADLERRLADHCRQEAALVFSSGYLANLAVVSALTDSETLIVSDAHIHASLVDATRLSRARVAVVPHKDLAAIERALRERTEPRALVLTESVFSVLGDAAPLTQLAELCTAYGAVLVVDEAHGLGVTGGGHGSVADLGLAGQDNVVVTVTLSKALGSQGGAVVGSALLIQHLVSRARPFIYDTALAPAAAGGARAALQLIGAEPDRVARVSEVALRLAQACGVRPVAGAVLSVPMPGPAEAVAAARWCADQGVRVGCFRPPSVPDGVSRLRLTASAAVDHAALEHACAVVAKAAQWT